MNETSIHGIVITDAVSMKAYEAERKRLFNEIRHFIAARHLPPSHLLLNDLRAVFTLLKGD